MQSRKYYEAYWSQYDDVVTLNEFRKMLGGLGEVQARRLLQNKTVKSFKIRGEYHIPKQCVIDYVLSSHYAKYRQILKAQIPKQKITKEYLVGGRGGRPETPPPFFISPKRSVNQQNSLGGIYHD